MGRSTDDFFAHYGVKGMRWGVRRRADGTVERTGKRMKSEDYTTSREIMKKRPYEMSNSELKKLNERLQLEQTYAQLSQKNNVGKVRKGENYVKTATSLGKTASEVYNLVNSPAGKAAAAAVKVALNK